MKRSLLVFLCLAGLAACLLSGCRADASDPLPENIETGGRVDRSDYSAPKVIESQDLTGLQARFYLYDPYAPGEGRGYFFTLGPDEAGQLTLRETSAWDVSSPVEPSVLTDAQEIVARFGLARYNGTDSYTAGLPAEFQPCFLSADYASGEHLYFYMNGDPMLDWGCALSEYFRQVFADLGFTEVLPPPEATTIEQFSLNFSRDGKLWQYGTSLYAEPGGAEAASRTVLFRTCWDAETGAFLSDDWAELPEGALAELQQVLEQSGLEAFCAGIQEEPDESGPFYDFTFDYVNGRYLHGCANGPQAEADFAVCRDRFTACLDPLMDAAPILMP